MKKTMKSLALLTCFSAVLFGAATPILAADAPDDPRLPWRERPAWHTELTGTRTEVQPLVALVAGGFAQDVRLTGTDPTQTFQFGVRTDEQATNAVLDLTFTASPSLLAQVSQLNIYLNGQLQSTQALTRDTIGKKVKLTVPLDAKKIQSANQLQLEFVGHYQTACESPANSALWLSVDRESALTLTMQKVRLANDLSQWPAPFFDPAQRTRAVVPFVFAGVPGDTARTAAAVVASAGGAVASWRGADFPVYFNQVPAAGNFIALATNESRPAFLANLPRATGPEIRMMDAPDLRADKVLVLSGRDEADLLVAAKALATGSLVLKGPQVAVTKFTEPDKRNAYDAPRWMQGNDMAAFGEMAQYQGALTARGYQLPPVHLTVPFAPDLFSAGDGQLDLHLKYRYTKPLTGERGQMTVRVNNFLAGSVNLDPNASRQETEVHLMAPEGPLSTQNPDGLALALTNDVALQANYELALSSGTPDNCRSVTLLPRQLEIDPTSTINLKGFYHYAKLPNLALFASSGFPFSKYADLSGTVAVMSKTPAAGDLSSLFNSVARIAAVTGYPAIKLTVTSNPAAADFTGKDILLVAPMPVDFADYKAENAAALQTGVSQMLSAKSLPANETTSLPVIAAGGPAGAIVSLQSPFDQNGTVVALLANGAASRYLVNSRLSDPAGLYAMKGSVTVASEAGLANFEVGSSYWTGYIPWYQKVWLAVKEYPLLLVLCALLCAIVVGTGIFFFMRSWIRRRG